MFAELLWAGPWAASDRVGESPYFMQDVTWRIADVGKMSGEVEGWGVTWAVSQ